MRRYIGFVPHKKYIELYFIQDHKTRDFGISIGKIKDEKFEPTDWLGRMTTPQDRSGWAPNKYSVKNISRMNVDLKTNCQKIAIKWIFGGYIK